MFSSDHAIWNFAYAGEELDDWLPHAEWLVKEWSVQASDEVKFDNTFDIILAAFLLEDDLLPASARAAFAKLMLKTIGEADANKLRIKCLHIHRPKEGRKEDRHETFTRFHEVKTLIQEGKTATEAYELVAERRFKSPDTIRRDYERNVNRLRKEKRIIKKMFK